MAKRMIKIGVIVVILLVVLINFMCSKEYGELVRELGRPRGAAMPPNPTNEITDIRMTVITRPFAPQCYFGGESLKGMTVLQVYYGYRLGDEWHDYPCENYNLKGILLNSQNSDWIAAKGSHMARIGPNLLVAIIDSQTINEVYDTLGTEVQEPFAEFFTDTYHVNENGEANRTNDANKEMYAYIHEDSAGIRNGTGDFNVWSCFLRRYYLVLKYDALPEDYELHVIINGEDNVFTREDIYALFDYKAG